MMSIFSPDFGQEQKNKSSLFLKDQDVNNINISTELINIKANHELSLEIKKHYQKNFNLEKQEWRKVTSICSADKMGVSATWPISLGEPGQKGSVEPVVYDIVSQKHPLKYTPCRQAGRGNGRHCGQPICIHCPFPSVSTLHPHTHTNQHT